MPVPPPVPYTQDVDTKDRPDAIRETVREEMAEIDGEWAFEVQLCRDLEKQPGPAGYLSAFGDVPGSGERVPYP